MPGGGEPLIFVRGRLIRMRAIGQVAIEQEFLFRISRGENQARLHHGQPDR